MKKLILACLIIVACAGLAYAGGTMNYSAVQTATANVLTGKGALYGILIATDGTNAVTLDIYDGTSTAGTKLMPQVVITTSATNRGAAIDFGESGVGFATGIHVVATCAGTVGYTLYYEKN